MIRLGISNDNGKGKKIGMKMKNLKKWIIRIALIPIA